MQKADDTHSTPLGYLKFLNILGIVQLPLVLKLNL